MNTERVETNTIVLEKLKFALFRALSAEEIDATVDVSMHTSFIANEMVVRLRSFIWSSKIDAVRIKYPEDWWQAFKERWFPGWLKVKYPVGYKQHVIDFYATYPEYKYVTQDPRFGKVIYKVMDNPW